MLKALDAILATLTQVKEESELKAFQDLVEELRTLASEASDKLIGLIGLLLSIHSIRMARHAARRTALSGSIAGALVSARVALRATQPRTVARRLSHRLSTIVDSTDHVLGSPEERDILQFVIVEVERAATGKQKLDLDALIEEVATRLHI